jgi:poly(3-hydroxyalkanoate) synthetase
MGNDTKFILSNSGHLQSLLNPPTNKKASFVTGPLDRAGPDAFSRRRSKARGELVAALARLAERTFRRRSACSSRTGQRALSRR